MPLLIPREKSFEKWKKIYLNDIKDQVCMRTKKHLKYGVIGILTELFQESDEDG